MSDSVRELLRGARSVRSAPMVLPPGGSLRAVLDTERALHIDRWRKREVEYRNRGWTGQCNGVTTDGSTWLVTSNREPPVGPAALAPEAVPTLHPGVFEVDDAGRVLRHHHIPRAVAGHVGDVDLFGDSVFVALEKPNQLLVLDRGLSAVRQRRRIDTPDGHFAWCAIHPWNGLLYTSAWDGAGTLTAFDPTSVDRVPDADIGLGRVVHRVQGGAFSPDGRVFLACDEKEGAAPRPGVHAFSAATGGYLGYLPVEVRHGAPRFEEIEGLGFGRRVLGGHEYLIHLVLLDQDPVISGDDIHLKSYGPVGGA